MKSFELKVSPARIVFGPGTLGRTGDMIRELGCSRALVLSTPNQKGAAETLAAGLGDLAAGVFTGATMHTPVDVTEKALAVLRETGADCTVAFGAGLRPGWARRWPTARTCRRSRSPRPMRDRRSRRSWGRRKAGGRPRCPTPGSCRRS